MRQIPPRIIQVNMAIVIALIIGKFSFFFVYFKAAHYIFLIEMLH